MIKTPLFSFIWWIGKNQSELNIFSLFQDIPEKEAETIFEGKYIDFFKSMSKVLYIFDIMIYVQNQYKCQVTELISV